MAPLVALVLLSSLWASPSTGVGTTAPATTAGDWKGVLQPGPGKGTEVVSRAPDPNALAHKDGGAVTASAQLAAGLARKTTRLRSPRRRRSARLPQR
jgi:hypothetical protein